MELTTNRHLPPEERFWLMVDKRGPDDCWPWAGCRLRHGYGHFNVNGRKTLAHRFSWSLVNGPIPDGNGWHGTCVLHRCDNPPCVNPAHLFLGTQADNIDDMIAKGRNGYTGQRGEKHGMAKLTESQVIEIRRRYAIGNISQEKLAFELGVSQTTIGSIVRRDKWTHVA